MTPENKPAPPVPDWVWVLAVKVEPGPGDGYTTTFRARPRGSRLDRLDTVGPLLAEWASGDEPWLADHALLFRHELHQAEVNGWVKSGRPLRQHPSCVGQVAVGVRR